MKLKDYFKLVVVDISNDLIWRRHGVDLAVAARIKFLFRGQMYLLAANLKIDYKHNY